jgi:hypothetical protein
MATIDRKDLIAGFLQNHDWLLRLFQTGTLGPDQHGRLHALNWLLLEKKLFDEHLHEYDLEGAMPEMRQERAQEVLNLLAQIKIADIGWRAIDLKTAAEILKEAEV